VTLTEPGGTGKTRLALRVGGDVLPSFDDGVFFVPLAAITDPAAVASVVAQTLGVKEEGREAIAPTLSRHLQDKELLLVLDNFAQVVEPALPLEDRRARTTAAPSPRRRARR